MMIGIYIKRLLSTQYYHSLAQHLKYSGLLTKHKSVHNQLTNESDIFSLHILHEQSSLVNIIRNTPTSTQDIIRPMSP